MRMLYVLIRERVASGPDPAVEVHACDGVAGESPEPKMVRDDQAVERAVDAVKEHSALFAAKLVRQSLYRAISRKCSGKFTCLSHFSP